MDNKNLIENQVFIDFVVFNGKKIYKIDTVKHFFTEPLFGLKELFSLDRCSVLAGLKQM